MTLTMNQVPEIVAQALEELIPLQFSCENPILDTPFLALYEAWVEEMEEEEFFQNYEGKYIEHMREDQWFLYHWGVIDSPDGDYNMQECMGLHDYLYYDENGEWEGSTYPED